MLTIQQKCEELEKSIETQVIPLMPKINKLNKEFIQASIDNENLRIKLLVTKKICDHESKVIVSRKDKALRELQAH